MSTDADLQASQQRAVTIGRDRILAAVVWLACLFMLATTWASLLEAGRLEPLLQEPAGGRTPDLWPMPALAWLVAALLPAAAILTGTPRAPDAAWARLKNAFHSRHSYLAILFGYAALQLLLFDESLIGDPLFNLGLTAVGSLAVLWHFWQRREARFDAIALTCAWAASLTLTRRLLQSVFASTEFGAASLPTQVLITSEVAYFALLAVAPILLARSARMARLPTALRDRPTLIRWLTATTLSVTAVVLVVAQWADEELIRVVLVTAVWDQVVVVVAGLLVASAIHSPEPAPQGHATPERSAGFMLGMCLLLAAYTALAALIIPRQLDRLNPDALSYLSIARSYAEGGFPVRGYWSPLISWLTALPIAAGVDPRLAFKVVSAAGGLVWIVAADALARRAGLRHVSRLAIAACVAYSALAHALSLGHLGASDVLGAAGIAAYFTFLLKSSDTETPIRSGVKAGLAGGLAYFAKHYNLPFMLIHLPLTAATLRMTTRSPRKVYLALLAAGVTIAVLAAPWIASLTSRYGRLTFSTATTIALSLRGGTSHPDWCPVPEDVLFPFEDPNPDCYPAAAWNPLGSLADFTGQILLVHANITDWLRTTVFGWGPLPPVGLLVLLIVSLTGPPFSAQRLRPVLALGTLVLYLLGYMQTHAADYRFYLAMLPVLLIAAYSFGEWLVGRLFRPNRSHAQADRVLAAAALLLPLLTFGRLSSLQYQLQNESETCLRIDSEAAAQFLTPPIAGTDEQISQIAYYARTQTYGFLSLELPPQEFDQILRGSGVSTVLAPVGHPLTDSLMHVQGYAHVATVEICEADYEVLNVPGD